MATSLNPNPPPDAQADTVKLSRSTTESGFNNNKKTRVIRDDWEDDDEDEIDAIGKPEEDLDMRYNSPVDTDEHMNKKIWEAANSKGTTPMPTLLSSRTGSVIFPPPAVFQPTMHILKRPASSSPSPGNRMASSSSSSGETIQDREARYAAARERIFGSENPEKMKHLKVAEEHDSGTHNVKA